MVRGLERENGGDVGVGVGVQLWRRETIVAKL